MVRVSPESCDKRSIVHPAPIAATRYGLSEISCPRHVRLRGSGMAAGLTLSPACSKLAVGRATIFLFECATCDVMIPNFSGTLSRTERTQHLQRGEYFRICIHMDKSIPTCVPRIHCRLSTPQLFPGVFCLSNTTRHQNV